jgi:triacylglycerol lipase
MYSFEPNATLYSPVNALSLARAARLAYHDQFAIASLIRNWNFTQFHFFEQNNTQAFMMGNDQLIVLAFRGTEGNSIKDWMTDVSINLIEDCYGEVHRGFSFGLNEIWQDVLLKLKSFRTQNQPLFITGHSLGAALATIAAARLSAPHQVQGVYTFGSPRVGNQDFAACFDSVYSGRAFRFVNNNDLVTRVAPREFGYKHVSQSMYFDAIGKLHPEINAWNKFLETVKGGMNVLNDFGLVSDHDMGKYEANLLQDLTDRQTLSFTNQRGVTTINSKPIAA